MALWRSAGSCIVQPITYKSCTAQSVCLGFGFGRGGGSVDSMSLSCADDPVTSIRKQNRNKRIHIMFPVYKSAYANKGATVLSYPTATNKPDELTVTDLILARVVDSFISAGVDHVLPLEEKAESGAPKLPELL